MSTRRVARERKATKPRNPASLDFQVSGLKMSPHTAVPRKEQPLRMKKFVVVANGFHPSENRARTEMIRASRALKRRRCESEGMTRPGRERTPTSPLCDTASRVLRRGQAAHAAQSTYQEPEQVEEKTSRSRGKQEMIKSKPHSVTSSAVKPTRRSHNCRGMTNGVAGRLEGANTGSVIPVPMDVGSLCSTVRPRPRKRGGSGQLISSLVQ